MQDKLILLVGPSGSGKTTISKELEKEGYNIIHSYTTRMPREPNEWGHTFIPQLENKKVNYISHSGLSIINIEGTKSENSPFTGKAETVPYIYYNANIIAYTFYGGHHYWATREQYQGKKISIYVIDPAGVESMENKILDAEVVTIFLMADKHTRTKRMILDGRLAELVLARLESDEKIFSICKCDYVVDSNRELGQVVADIKEIIEGI